MNAHHESLAQVAADEVVTVRRILFGCLETHCAGLGVHEGDRLRVLGGDARGLLVQKPGGTVVKCPPDLARFIEVRREADA